MDQQAEADPAVVESIRATKEEAAARQQEELSQTVQEPAAAAVVEEPAQLTQEPDPAVQDLQQEESAKVAQQIQNDDVWGCSR